MKHAIQPVRSPTSAIRKEEPSGNILFLMSVKPAAPGIIWSLLAARGSGPLPSGHSSSGGDTSGPFRRGRRVRTREPGTQRLRLRPRGRIERESRCRRCSWLRRPYRLSRRVEQPEGPPSMKASGVKDRRSPVTHLLDLLYESAIIAAHLVSGPPLSVQVAGELAPKGTFARIAVRAAAAIPDARGSGPEAEYERPTHRPAARSMWSTSSELSVRTRIAGPAPAGGREEARAGEHRRSGQEQVSAESAHMIREPSAHERDKQH
jgi:hypothetical protein